MNINLFYLFLPVFVCMLIFNIAGVIYCSYQIHIHNKLRKEFEKDIMGKDYE